MTLIVLILPPEIIKEASIVGKVASVVRIIGFRAPVFNHTLENYTIYKNSTFILDINCTDADPLDYVTYHDNFTGFDINITTGLINQTGFNEILVGNNTINITCRDSFGLEAHGIFILEILEVNDPPVLDYIGPLIAVEGEWFYYDINATDPENDTLSYNALTTLFDVDNETGEIAFVPTFSQIGNYTINFTVFDREFYDWEIVSFTIVRGPYCGDGTCDVGEGCDTCPQDCGPCPPPVPSEEEGEPGEPGEESVEGAIGTGGPIREPFYRCDERWECSDWSICFINGLRFRECIDINNCGTEKNKPHEQEECEYIPTCFDGVMNGEEEGIDCGGPCEPCLVANCFDGIQNCHDGLCEEGIDCGGPCEPCIIEEETKKAPFLEILTKFPRNFPWFLLILLVIILLLTVIADQSYIHHIKKKKLKEYRELRAKYRPIRRKVYTVLINISLIFIIVIFYLYYFSNDIPNLIKFYWIPLGIILFIPLLVSIVIKKFTYYEYKKRKKEKRLGETHKRELLQLVRTENELLYDLESKERNQIYSSVKHHEFEESPSIYKEIRPAFDYLTVLKKKREERFGQLKLPNEILEIIINLIQNENLKKAGKDYPEFISILSNLKYIEDNRDIDTTDKEDDLLYDVNELSQPHMKTVIMDDHILVDIYNQLVKVFDFYKERHKTIQKKDDEILNEERVFTEHIKEITKKVQVMELIQSNDIFIRVYNGLVELYNHYTKQFQLTKSIKDLSQSI